MIFTLIKKDLIKNKAINIVLLLFIVLSASLLSSATIIGLQLTNSIKVFYEIANPPHFLQMHKGKFKERKIDEFVKKSEDIIYEQTIEMLNIEGISIWIMPKNKGQVAYSLADSVIENGFFTQNEAYDLLLDMENQKLEVAQGEIGIPLLYTKSYNIEIGDTLTISQEGFSKSFRVASFVRDAQMNSSMVSSTRFLVNKEDYQVLKQHLGETEYIFEFYFKDVSTSKGFQSIYEKAGLPKNGPAITYGQMKLLSSISDMAMIVMFILVSVLLSVIAIMCLRFTIVTVLEEEIKEIGAMKAIGISYKDITNLYIGKYTFLTVVGCFIGYILSFEISQIFMKHIAETFGTGKIEGMKILLPVLVVGLAGVMIIKICRKILNQIKHYTVLEAINGNMCSRVSKSNSQLNLTHFKKLPVNLSYALKEVWLNKRSWALMSSVVGIATLIIIMPFELYMTISSPEFITNMGSPKCDLRIDLQTADQIQEKYQKILGVVEKDDQISEYIIYASCTYEAINKDNEWANIRVDCGEKGIELGYIYGQAPKNQHEIAISLLNAEELGKQVGDTLTMRIGEVEQQVRVSGIYQDVTSGGYTAKMLKSFDPKDVASYTIFINMQTHIDLDKKVEAYSHILPIEAKVRVTEEFIAQTFGGMKRQLKEVINLVIILAIGIVTLITILFLKMHVVKDYSSIAVMKAIGFSAKDIINQYMAKTSVVTLIGVMLGTLIAGTMGQKISGGMLAAIGIGITKINFVVNPFLLFIGCGTLLICIVRWITHRSVSVIKNYQIMSLINE